jgi:hypothetical protein
MADQFEGKTIQQIVAYLGDGKLRDESACSKELREYLTSQSSEKLSEYVRQCLDEKFEKSGLVLQDVVNEIGRRLGYAVTHGRYQGVTNDIGFDGLWEAANSRIVVEVKTTDAYRINLDTIHGYVKKLEVARPAAALEHSSLIVVGRQDTGDLEAQVRGSRHAWSTRLISADALVKLMYINEEVDDTALVERIRRVLAPFEYTRVDNIVDLLFEAQQDLEQKAQAANDLTAAHETAPGGEGTWEFTPREQLRAKRSAIVERFFNKKKLTPKSDTASKYSDGSGLLSIVCSVSKRYKNVNRPYWYALSPQWLDYLRTSNEGYFLLGCMDQDEAYALPLSVLDKHLADLNTTEKPDRQYWHIELTFDDKGGLALSLPRSRKKLPLSEYSFRTK